MLQALSPEERLRLVRFVCSFAWADLELTEDERRYVGRLVSRLELSPKERRQVLAWIELPPAPDEVDPQTIPRRHRELFLDAIRGVIAADLDISDEERAGVRLLEQLLV